MDSDVPHDAGHTDVEPLPGGVHPPAPAASESALDAIYGACSTAAERTARNVFSVRYMNRARNMPSTGQGLFDASYLPLADTLWITFKVKFNFVPADFAPDPITRFFLEYLTGVSFAPLYWTPAEEAAFQTDYLTRVATRWSRQHDIISTKPCWGFHAMSVVLPEAVDDPARAHYVYTVHKQPSGFAYRSSTGFPTPTTAGSGDLWSSDIRENPNFASAAVATSERSRLESALAAAHVTPVLFERDSADLTFWARFGLALWASALRGKQPSDPLIPIRLDGYASAEGETGRNRDLSRRRAEAVRDALLAMGVPQPIVLVGRGPIGTPNDPANRRVEISVDHAFEATYASNRLSGAEHEFGHAIGLPDEYMNNAPGSGAPAGWIALQTQSQRLFAAAGVSGPATWGNYTSSIMSSGVDVLPRHYITFWEALARMTDPDITQAQWRIV